MTETEQKQFAEAQKFGKIAENLLKNADFLEDRKALEAHRGQLLVELQNTETIDPKIAELQGKLRMLKIVVDRPLEQIQEAADMSQRFREDGELELQQEDFAKG